MHNSWKLLVLRQRAAAEGITTKQFEDVYEACHDMASCELWDDSEDAQNYMAELWTRSVLCKLMINVRMLWGCFADILSVFNDTGVKAFDSTIHDFTEALITIATAAKDLPATEETIARLVSYRDVSEKLVAIARFALRVACVANDKNPSSVQGQSPNSTEEREQVEITNAHYVEENNELRLRIKELESSLQRQKDEFEVLKSLIYD